MSIEKKVKTALDETRLLILGVSILLGFQFNGVFHEGFEDLNDLAQRLDALALMLMSLVLALLIMPTMQHRIVERGLPTIRLQRATTFAAGLALGPFATALGIDLFIALDRPFGSVVAVTAGAFTTLLALALWYGVEMLWRREVRMPNPKSHEPVSISVKIEQMLTEARVLLPGVQALMGFGLAITLNRSFEQLPGSSKAIHAAALIFIAVAVILLMAPAAIHRISFQGEDTEEFHRIGSRFVVIAPAFLGLGMTADTYVVLTKILDSPQWGVVAALGVLIGLTLLWYVLPMALRRTYADAAARDR